MPWSACFCLCMACLEASASLARNIWTESKSSPLEETIAVASVDAFCEHLDWEVSSPTQQPLRSWASSPTLAGWSWLPRASSQQLGPCLWLPRPKGQLSKDAPHPAVTMGAFTLKAHGNDLPEHKHPPPQVCTKLCPSLRKWKVLISSPLSWSKSLGRSRPNPAPGSLPGQHRGQSTAVGPGQKASELLVTLSQTS